MFPGETPERIQHALLGNDVTGAINYLLDDDSKWKFKWYLNFPYINPLMTKLLQNGPFIILLYPMPDNFTSQRKTPLVSMVSEIFGFPTFGST